MGRDGWEGISEDLGGGRIGLIGIGYSSTICCNTVCHGYDLATIIEYMTLLVGVVSVS